MHIHDALVLNHGDELLIQITHLGVSSLMLTDHALQIFRFDVLSKFRKTSQEVVHRLFIFEALASVVSELIVEIMTVTD